MGFNNDLTEKAVLLLKATYRDYHDGVRASAHLGRAIVVHPRLGRHTNLHTRRESCLFRMVSIAEAFVDVLFDFSLRASLAVRSDTAEQLILNALEHADTWPRRKDFATRFKIPLTTFPQWDQVTAATAARNSIAHALGGITPRQRERSMHTMMAKIDISVVDGRLQVSDASLSRVCLVLVEFVEYLDQKCGAVERP
jgi:hypothetical protein